MKIIPLVAAAALAAFAVPAAASAAPASAPAAAPAAAAQHHWGHGNRRAHWRRVCTTSWRHHRRVRVCRKVRTWR